MGVDDDAHKQEKKAEIDELKKMLIQVAGSIKLFITAVDLYANAEGDLSGSIQNLVPDRNGSGCKGYAHAEALQKASVTTEGAARATLETCQDAHDSLLRKIADFKTIEKQMVEFETALLDMQAYERKMKDAEAAKEKASASGKPGDMEAVEAKFEKAAAKLSQSRASYNAVRGALWNAFDWYGRAGGLLAAQEAEALRAAQVAFLLLPSATSRPCPPTTRRSSRRT